MLIRRLFLIFPLGSIVWWILYEPGREIWYVAPVALISSFIIFYNIPWLVRVLHLKPVYYEDLEDDEVFGDPGDEESAKNRYKFQNYFTLAITILLSITFCIVLDYIFYNFKESELEWQERLGLIGGAISLYGKIQDKIGKVLLMCMMRSKTKHQIRRRSISKPMIPLDNKQSDNKEEFSEIEL